MSKLAVYKHMRIKTEKNTNRYFDCQHSKHYQNSLLKTILIFDDDSYMFLVSYINHSLAYVMRYVLVKFFHVCGLKTTYNTVPWLMNALKILGWLIQNLCCILHAANWRPLQNIFRIWYLSLFNLFKTDYITKHFFLHCYISVVQTYRYCIPCCRTRLTWL